jgi:hypothetical protein
VQSSDFSPILSNCSITIYSYFPSVLGFKLKAYTLSHSTSPFFCVLGFFKIGSQELFVWAGFKPDPPHLCFLSSNYRHELPVPSYNLLLMYIEYYTCIVRQYLKVIRGIEHVSYISNKCQIGNCNGPIPCLKDHR